MSQIVRLLKESTSAYLLLQLANGVISFRQLSIQSSDLLSHLSNGLLLGPQLLCNLVISFGDESEFRLDGCNFLTILGFLESSHQFLFVLFYTVCLLINKKYNFRKMIASQSHVQDSNERIKNHRKNLLSLLSLKRSILQYEKSPQQKKIGANESKASTINLKKEQPIRKNNYKQSKTIHTDVSTSDRHLQRRQNNKQVARPLSVKSNSLTTKCVVKQNIKKQPQDQANLKHQISLKIKTMQTVQSMYETTKKNTSNKILAKENVQNRVKLFIDKYKSNYRMQQRKTTAADLYQQEIQKMAKEAVKQIKQANQQPFYPEQKVTQQDQTPIRTVITSDHHRGKSTIEGRPTIKARLQMKQQIQKKVLLKDRYQILQRIGRGLSGQVYKAKDILSDRLVAIKIITENNKKQDQYQFYKSIQHKNIVSYYNNFISNGNRYLVLEYFPSTLHKVCKNRRLNQLQIKKAFKGIANGLMFLHGLGIAHRDIKLDNIVVSQDLAQIKFIDFGLCIDLSKCDNQKTKQFCGTILYMPPQILEKRAYNPKKADIWSLGILLYRLLFNKFPFNSRNQFMMLQRIRKTKVVTGQCDQNLSLLLQGMLNKNANDRYTIMDVMDNKWVS